MALPRVASLWARKVLLFGMCGLSACLMYVIRTLPSIAIDGPNGMAQEYGWTNTDRGKVLSAFFYGYCALQWPGGILASRFGGKGAMFVVVVGSAIVNSAIPFVPGTVASTTSVLIISVLRAVTGLVQGPLYPSWAVLVTEWLEPDEYALASGTFSAGSCVGIVVAWLAGPAIIDTKVLGWRWAFWGSSLLTLPWLLAWVLVAASRPPSTLLQVQTRSSHRYIDVADDDRRAQRQLIKPLLNTDDDGDDGGDGAGESINSSSRASRSRSSRSRSRNAANGTRHAKPRNGSLPNIYQNIDHDDSIDDADSIDDGRSNEIDFDKPGTPREIASSPAFLGSLVVGFVGSWAVYMFLTFLPQYMQQRFNFQLAKAGWVSMLPYLARGLVLFATGFLGDWMLRRAGWKTVNVRILMTVLPLIISGAALAFIINAPSSDVSVVLLIVAVSSTGALGAGSSLVPIDLFPAKVGGLFGLFNMICNTAGFITPHVTGHMLDRAHCPSARQGGGGSNHSGNGSGGGNGTGQWHPMTDECKKGWQEAFMVATALLAFGAALSLVTYKADKRYRALS